MKPWAIVFRKEFFEIFRDPRTWIGSVLVPLLITPLLLSLVGTMARKRATEAASEKIVVGIVGLEKAPSLQELLRGSELAPDNVRLETVARRADAEARVVRRELRAAVVVPDDAEARLRRMETVPLTVLRDEGSEDSLGAGGRVERLLHRRAERLTALRLVEQGLTQQLARPFEVVNRPVAGGGGAGMAMLSVFLPYILAIYAVVGGAGVAIDSVAGEKERSTLETLLVSPVSRRDLVIGKFSAVVAATLLSSVLSLVGLIARVSMGFSFTGDAADTALKLTPMAIAGMFLVQLPLAVMGAGALMAVSTFARNQKEAQTYLMPLMMGASVGAMMSMFVRAEAPLYWAAAPVLNAALVLKQALAGTIQPAFVGIACIASILYAAVAVFYARSVFEKESVLLKA